MPGPFSRLMLCLGLLSGLSAVPARAADAPCLLCENPAETAPETPLALEVESQLDFDRLILTGPGDGRAILGPDGEQRVSGPLQPLSGRTMIGRIVIRGEANRAITVDLPASVELTSAAGGLIRIESLVTDLPRDARLDSDGQLVVQFGGELLVSGDIDGDFRGQIRVGVDYL